MIAAITVNDSDHNKIVGTKGIVSYAYTNDVKPETISWTSVGLASDRTYAFCAVTYTTTKNKTIYRSDYILSIKIKTVILCKIHFSMTVFYVG